MINFNEMTVRELREYCKENGIPGYSKHVKAGKAALVQFVSEYAIEKKLPEQVAETQHKVDVAVSRVEEVTDVATSRWYAFCDALKTPAGWLTILFVLIALFFRSAVYLGQLTVRAYKGWAVAISMTIDAGRNFKKWVDGPDFNPPFIVRVK